MPNAAQRPRATGGFTLIELLVVVAIIAVLSGLVLPLVIKLRDKARTLSQPATQPQSLISPAADAALPTGVPPTIESVALQLKLTSSYHRIGLDVYTRYTVQCSGRLEFGHPGGTRSEQVLLLIPFPEDIIEARDVELKLAEAGTDESYRAEAVEYHRTGIYCTCPLEPGQRLVANVSFVAAGRERFVYRLPPARRMQQIDVSLDLDQVPAWSIPDEALQPSEVEGNRVRWNLKNLVSDSPITVLIPGVQAPLAQRVLVLLRLMAVAVLLFGAGFWYLSEQATPGRLDKFRLGHFLLLALTYSLFFVIFTVLEFHGELGTPASMAVSALFSLPLLALHVSRVLDLQFAVTRVVPLAVFTLGLVINGVYGGRLRDYVFIAAVVLILGYVTVTYRAWTANRDKRRQELDAELAALRERVAHKLNDELGQQINALTAADSRASSLLRSSIDHDPSDSRPHLQAAQEPVAELRKAYADLKKRFPPAALLLDWDRERYSHFSREIEALAERVESSLSYLQAEIGKIDKSAAANSPAQAGEVHCVACGHAVPDAPFCQRCGAPRAVARCATCGKETVVPLHLIAKDKHGEKLHCEDCGMPLVTPAKKEAASQT